MKKLTFGDKARKKLFEGIKKLEAAVGATLGPKGRTVILETNHKSPHPTKDGVTVAKDINLKDPIENLGLTLVRQASEITNDKAGDGTTTSVVLAKALIQEALRLVSTGIDPSVIKNEYRSLSKRLLEFLAEKAIKPTKELLKSIVVISSNSDKEVYDLVNKAFELATAEGVITTEISKYGYSYVEKVNGYSFEKGIASPALFPDRSDLKVELENPFIILYDDKVRNSEDILPLLKRFATEYHERPVIFIADEFNPQALHIMTTNNHTRGFQFYAVTAPSFGQNRDWMLEDIAILTGGVVVSPNAGVTIREATTEYAGQADKVVIGIHETSIIGGNGDPEEIQDRVKYIKSQISVEANSWDNDMLKARIARLTGGAAKIKVFAPTESELKEKKDRVEDSLHAYRAAVKSGILPGGGISLVRFASQFKDPTVIQKSFLDAIKSPFNRILSNAGISSEAILEKIKDEEFNIGYDAKNEEIADLIDEGIVDSLMVVSQAITNAVSSAITVLMSEVTVTNIPGTEVDLSTPPTMQM